MSHPSASRSPWKISKYFLFEVGKDSLRVTAHNVSTFMTNEFRVSSKETGSIAVPAKLLYEMLKNMGDNALVFSIDMETFLINVSSDFGSYKFMGANPEDFPSVPKGKPDFSTKVPSSVMYVAIDLTELAVYKNDEHPGLGGVLVRVGKESTAFVSYNFSLLVLFERSDITSDEQHNLIVPGDALSALKSVISPTQGTVEFSLDPDFVYFTVDGYTITARKIVAPFFHYEKSLPVGDSVEIRVKREEFQNALNRISPFSIHPNSMFKMSVSGNEMTLHTRNEMSSNEAREKLPCNHEGEGSEKIFSTPAIIASLSHMKGEEVRILLNRPEEGSLLRPVEEEESEKLIVLVLPFTNTDENEF